jgi:NADPH-dependent 2,4-dienoyl-CoA reductase/sulfur reductase-like enzyme
VGIGRRRLLGAGLAGSTLGLLGCGRVGSKKPIGRVVVVGGGFGGATAAKYIRKWEPRIEVTLVERNELFVSCPVSNLVLAGLRGIDDVTLPYSGLAKYGVNLVRDEATAIDVDRRQVRLARGAPLPYDRLVVAPGIDFQFDRVPGLAAADASGRVLHAWKAGAQTVALRRQLEAMPDGGVFAISIPRVPFRCPPGPYERASVVAHYFKAAKPRSKVVVLDANPDVASKKDLFVAAWNELYPGVIEYRPNSELIGFDARTGVARLEVEDFAADVFNVIPPQQAGRIAQPLISVDDQWVGVEFLTFESEKVSGDAIATAYGMPKSAFMANNHAKLVADAVIARLTGAPVNEAPILANTCYSYVSDREVVHVASVHKWDAAKKTMLPVQGSGGLSGARTELEAHYAQSWARNIWDDVLN